MVSGPVVHWQVLQCALRVWFRFARLCLRPIHGTPLPEFVKYQHDLNFFRSCGCRGSLASALMCPLPPFLLSLPPLPSPLGRGRRRDRVGTCVEVLVAVVLCLCLNDFVLIQILSLAMMLDRLLLRRQRCN